MFSKSLSQVQGDYDKNTRGSRSTMNSIILGHRRMRKKLNVTEEKYLGKYSILIQHEPHYEGIIQNLFDYVKPIWLQWESAMEPIIKEELDGPVSIKMDGHNKFSTEQILHLTETIEKTKSTNPFLIIESMIENIMSGLPENLPTQETNRTYPTRVFIKVFWQELLMLWHQDFIHILMQDIVRKFNDKLLLGKGFHNFSHTEIEGRILDILAQGENYVTHQKTDIAQCQKEFKSLVWHLVRWAGKRWNDERHDSSNWSENNLEELFATLIEDETRPLHLFYVSVCQDYYKFKGQINNECNSEIDPAVLIKRNELVNKVLQPGLICAVADKHYGLALLPLDVVKKAEREFLQKLGAVQEIRSPRQILENIEREEENLRNNISQDMTDLLGCFPPIPTQHMPFLKMAPKIHKLSSREIKEKNTESLTFRPICDSQFYTTKPCAQALGSLLISLKKKVICLYPSMESFYPLDSYDVARKMRNVSFPPKEPYSLIVSCDMTDAYSNCTLEDLLVCANFLSKVAAYEGGEQENIKILAEFVLNNNYIESAGTIYKFNPILPMGCCLSGDALDIILMAGELRVFINPDLDSSILEHIPPYMKELNDVLKVIDYERFRDDTKIIISSHRPMDIVQSLETFAKNMFPPKIPISCEYSTFLQSFLGCQFFINFAGRSFSTYPRLNFSRPSKAIHVSSNTWKKHIMSCFSSNAVSYSRLCSEAKMKSMTMQLLKGEMKLAGHSEDDIKRWHFTVDSSIKEIEYRDVETMETGCKQHGRDNSKIYAPTATYNSHTNVHQLYEELTKNAMDVFGNVGRSMKNLPTLKKILVTKDNYRKQIGSWSNKR